MKFFLVAILLSIPCSLTAGFSTNTRALIPSASSTIVPNFAPTSDPSPSWKDDPPRQSKHVHDFFKSFGWLGKGKTIRDGDMPAAIRKIQKILREPETGIYDERMETVMSRPRCGTEQPYNETDAKLNDTTPHERYVLWGPKWDHTSLTYRFINFTGDLASDRQKTIVRSVGAFLHLSEARLGSLSS
jgi:hypothetical protein